MRKKIADIIHEAMEQHELARDFYHRLATGWPTPTPGRSSSPWRAWEDSNLRPTD